ncbi:MAG: FecR domain-containing protein [Spirochaetales bacterium]
MKRFLLLCLVATAAAAFAQEATVTFVDGDVDIQREGGARRPADFGSELENGDRIITEGGGYAELELASGGTVEVSGDTVFLVGSESGSGGEPQGRVAAAVGAFVFRFNATVGNEPRIGSTTSVAGVRGTEVRVYAASDGTTRYEVVEGRLEVQDGGVSVSLGPNEAVEVRAGGAPSSVFSFLENPIDYSVWNAGLVQDFLLEPLNSLDGIADEMNSLIAEINRRVPEYERLRAIVDEEEAAMAEIADDGDREDFFENQVMSARREFRAYFVDLRFVVLSALSLEQFVISRLAAEMQAAYFDDPENPTLGEFLTRVSDIRAGFEEAVVPWLVPSDL